MNKTAKANKWNAPGRLSRDVQNRLGDQLRKMHDEIVQQGVPDRFRELLEQLGGNDTGKSDDEKGSSGGA